MDVNSCDKFQAHVMKQLSRAAIGDEEDKTHAHRLARYIFAFSVVYTLFLANRLLPDFLQSSSVWAADRCCGKLNAQTGVDLFAPFWIVWLWWEIFACKAVDARLCLLGPASSHVVCELSDYGTHPPGKDMTLCFVLVSAIHCLGHGLRQSGLAFLVGLKALQLEVNDTELYDQMEQMAQVYTSGLGYGVGWAAILGMGCLQLARAQSVPFFHPLSTCDFVLIGLGGVLHGLTLFVQSIYPISIQRGLDWVPTATLLGLPVALCLLVISLIVACRSRDSGNRSGYRGFRHPLTMFVVMYSLSCFVVGVIWIGVKWSGWKQEQQLGLTFWL
jgi:hypothetical protein